VAKKRLVEAEVQAEQNAFAKRVRLSAESGWAFAVSATQQAEAELPFACDAWASLKKLKANMAIERRSRLACKASLADVAASWSASEGKRIVGAVAKVSSTVDFRAAEVEPSALSTSEFHILRWRPTDIPQRVRRVMKLRHSTDAAKSLFDKLSRAWDGLNTTVQFEVIEVLGEVVPNAVRRPCYDAGQCIHRGRGRLVAKFASNLDAKVKAVAKEVDGFKLKLREHEIVLLFIGQSKLMLESDVAAGQALLRCVHVGDATLSPFEMSYHEMSLTSAFVPSRDLKAPDIATAKFEFKYFKRIKFADSFQFNLRWSVCPAAVLCEERIIPAFLPDGLDFAPLVPGFIVFWDPFKPRSIPVVGFDNLLEGESGDDEVGDVVTARFAHLRKPLSH
jgi:hypothetical protein